VTDYVVDASALVLALTGKTRAAEALRDRVARVSHRHAPHLVDAEVGNVLRRHELHGRISPAEAHAALQAARVLVDHRYRHTGPLADLAWTLRASLTFYDALYAALAAHLGLSLMTADHRLSRASGLPCAVELV
jgi:predicted nucleic acid-binding protein